MAIEGVRAGGREPVRPPSEGQGTSQYMAQGAIAAVKEGVVCWHKVRDQEAKGHFEAAREQFEKAKDVAVQPVVQALSECIVSIDRGNRSEAEATIKELASKIESAQVSGVSLSGESLTREQRARLEDALRDLQKALADGGGS